MITEMRKGHGPCYRKTGEWEMDSARAEPLPYGGTGIGIWTGIRSYKSFLICGKLIFIV